MNKYSKRSKARLDTCHPILEETLSRVLPKVDHSILCGSRPKAEQDQAYDDGRSQKKWPDSMHNVTKDDGITEDPDGKSWAVDAVIYHSDKPHIRWDNSMKTYGEHCLFAGYVLNEAHDVLVEHGLEDQYYVRWGGDWNSDSDLHNNGFNDMVHFELRRK